MKIATTIISLSLAAGAAVLPVAASFAQSSSDRDTWIEQTLSKNSHSGAAAKKVSTAEKTSNAGGSLTSANGSNLAHSVAGLFPGVRMRPFVPNRYLPSEHDLELASAAQQQLDAAAQLPPSTAQLAKAMAQTRAMNTVQHQLQSGTSYTATSYTGGYSGGVSVRGSLLSARSAHTSATSMQNRVNALVPSIPEPMGGNETIEQIRSDLRSNQGGQLIADASVNGTTGSANLYPDIVGPVPTQATARSSAPFPLSLLPQKTARSYAYTGSGAGNRTNTSSSPSRSGNLPSATLGGWRTQPAQQQYAAQQFTNAQPQQSKSKLSYGGFQTYSGKVHVQAPSVQQTQNVRTGSGAGTYNTSALPSGCNIASADTTRVASYAPYSGGMQSSSSLPY